MPKCDKDMYQLICQERFAKIDGKQDEILNLLKGINSTPGLIEEVRRLRTRWAIIFGSLIIIFTAFATQTLKWIFSSL